MSRATARLPDDGTRQAEGILYGALGRQLNRWTGAFILGFVVVHVINEATLRLEPLPAFLKEIHSLDREVWAKASLHVIEGALYTSIAFHSLYGVKLIALDLGVRLETRYRVTFWVIAALALVPGLWQVVQIARP